MLACVTRHWLRDDDMAESLRLVAGPTQAAGGDLLVRGFDELQPEGADTDRAIANAMVPASPATSRAPAHTTAVITTVRCSPTEQRDFGVLTAHQSFDAGCRKIVEKKIGADIEALDKLLAAFRGPGSRKK